jgi:hypothetical protein
LFSCTGNSSVDYDWEDMSEFQPLSWEADNVAFAKELIEEAEGIMGDVQAGIETLKASPELMAAVRGRVEQGQLNLLEPALRTGR